MQNINICERSAIFNINFSLSSAMPLKYCDFCFSSGHARDVCYVENFKQYEKMMTKYPRGLDCEETEGAPIQFLKYSAPSCLNIILLCVSAYHVLMLLNQTQFRIFGAAKFYAVAIFGYYR